MQAREQHEHAHYIISSLVNYIDSIARQTQSHSLSDGYLFFYSNPNHDYESMSALVVFSNVFQKRNLSGYKPHFLKKIMVHLISFKPKSAIKSLTIVPIMVSYFYLSSKSTLIQRWKLEPFSTTYSPVNNNTIIDTVFIFLAGTALCLFIVLSFRILIVNPCIGSRK